MTLFITAKLFTTSLVFPQKYQLSLKLNSLQQKISLTSNYWGRNTVVVKRVVFSYRSILSFVLGAQKNHLIQTVSLSTHNIWFGWAIWKLIWAVAWDFQQFVMCDQQSLRSACAYAQSDKSLCLPLEYPITIRLLIEHHLEFLSLKSGCTGSFESTLFKMPHCWKSHVAAHL